MWGSSTTISGQRRHPPSIPKASADNSFYFLDEILSHFPFVLSVML
jgi:hypothetical protein